MTPPSSRLRIRENRSPSKVYEDTLIIERKIRSFGLFSEDLSWILMSLLKDNEELKGILKIGFKEIEREMSELDEALKNEVKQRSKEGQELKHFLNSKSTEIEEQLLKIEKENKQFNYKMQDNLDQTIEALKLNIDKQIEETLDKKLPDFDGRLNDMSAKMSLVFTNQDQKVHKLEQFVDQNKEELLHIVNKASDDLNKALESNYDDTTLAVVNLRKELSDELKCETEKRIEEHSSVRCEVNSLKDELVKEMQVQQEESYNKLESLQTCIQNVEEQLNNFKTDVKEVENTLLNNITEHKQLIDSSLKKIGRLIKYSSMDNIIL